MTLIGPGRKDRTLDLLDRILVAPWICHGQPYVKGTRIMVWLIVQYLANGDSTEDILAAYPALTREDIQACLAYAIATEA